MLIPSKTKVVIIEAIIWFFVGSKLLSITILLIRNVKLSLSKQLILRDVVDKALREEQYGYKKGGDVVPTKFSLLDQYLRTA